MTTFILAGLQWEVPSPSHFRLAPWQYSRPVIIDVSFLGDQWCLFFKTETGEVLTRAFPTRDQAIAMIVDAFKEEGCL